MGFRCPRRHRRETDTGSTTTAPRPWVQEGREGDLPPGTGAARQPRPGRLWLWVVPRAGCQGEGGTAEPKGNLLGTKLRWGRSIWCQPGEPADGARKHEMAPREGSGTCAALGHPPWGSETVWGTPRLHVVLTTGDAAVGRGVPHRAHRLTPSDDELYQRTRLTVLEPESPNIMFIEGYSNRGFTISGNVVVGPCAVLPRTILQWNVGSYRDISHESLSLFRLLEPRIEILVLGTGDRVERLSPAMLKQMRECGIAVEVQDTPNACATFNFLTSEKRMVAAGLIPPRGTSMGTSGAAALPLPA